MCPFWSYLLPHQKLIYQILREFPLIHTLMTTVPPDVLHPTRASDHQGSYQFTYQQPYYHQ